MFQTLDTTIKNLLAAAPPKVIPLHGADASFLTPDKNYRPSTPTANLFLYRVKENRQLRDPVPSYEPTGLGYIRHAPPLRVDCSYLVTAWSDPQVGGDIRVNDEHLLLGQAF